MFLQGKRKSLKEKEELTVKEKRLLDAASKEARPHVCKQEPPHVMGKCGHLGCEPLRDLLSSDLGEHVGVETAGYVREILDHFRVSPESVQRYARDYYGLSTFELRAVLITAAAGVNELLPPVAVADCDTAEVDQVRVSETLVSEIASIGLSKWSA